MDNCALMMTWPNFKAVILAGFWPVRIYIFSRSWRGYDTYHLRRKEKIKVKRCLQRWGLKSIAFLASWLVLGFNVAQAQSDFGNDDLDDSWGLSALGSITAEGLPFPIGTPLIAVGRATFDGGGGCAVIDQLNIGGTVLPTPTSFRTTDGDGSCTYTVNPDGTGFMSVTFGPSQPLPGTIDITFVMVDDDVIRFITTNTPGFSASGSLEEQNDD